MTYDNVGEAIGAFERGLVTPSRWDAFLAGDTAALTPAEQEGFNTFAGLGCPACHRGRTWVARCTRERDWWSRGRTRATWGATS